ncbi:hypothetical protein [Umezawaea tangerina]|uniref:Outer membrane channel protein CpnT-like N-terminal domain-containing protein n=1 Tax=Umezawaea tangerina TaxID=84725 RepID=A0A2T0TLE4_9PSEU|nr:hypothetical protein [Umezawaea tangerina]PRY46465.1 hypothetical protein CLV43_101741 [Umezawaea tangerina]
MSALDDEIHRQSREAGATAREFVQQVDTVLSCVPEPLEHLVAPVTRSLQAVALGVDELLGLCGKLHDECGDEDRLREVGLDWVARVGDATKRIADDIAPERFRSPVEWTGRAARAYQLSVPPQVAGLNAVSDIANQMRSSLNTLANAVEAFKMAMAFALAGFAVAAVAALAGAMTVVGAAPATAAVATAIGVSLALLGAAIPAMRAHVNTVKSEQTQLQQRIHDLGRTWAEPLTADMADASVGDGDGSDWRPGP